MASLRASLALLVAGCVISSALGTIKWTTIYKANGCDFWQSNIQVGGEFMDPFDTLRCFKKCLDNPKCTHYVANPAKKYCFLKMKEGVRPSDATETDDKKVECGIVQRP